MKITKILKQKPMLLMTTTILFSLCVSSQANAQKKFRLYHVNFSQIKVETDQSAASYGNENEINVGGVINIIGFDNLKNNKIGRLTLHDNDLFLNTGSLEGVIPTKDIFSFSFMHSNKALLRGPAGTLANLAPNGAGQIYSVIRPGNEILTLLYTDVNHALHAAVLMIPKKRKEDIVRAFEKVGVSQYENLANKGLSLSGETYSDRQMTPINKPSILVTFPTGDIQEFPIAYKAAIYEETIQKLIKINKFDIIWRDGDIRTNSDALTLSLDINGYRKGSARARSAIPVAGMIIGKTLIKAEMHLIDSTGKTLIEKKVKGSKIILGENIDATQSLTKRIEKTIKIFLVKSNDFLKK